MILSFARSSNAWSAAAKAYAVVVGINGMSAARASNSVPSALVLAVTLSPALNLPLPGPDSTTIPTAS